MNVRVIEQTANKLTLNPSSMISTTPLITVKVTMASNEAIPSIKSKVNPPSDSKTIPKGKESNEMKTESMNMDHDDDSAMIFRIDFTESSDEFKSS